MKPYAEMIKEELLALHKELKAQYRELQGKDLKLDMSRGKPCVGQLDLSMGLTDVLSSNDDLTCEDGTDCRSYGVFAGIDEAKGLIADMIEVNPSTVTLYDNPSLNVIYDTVPQAMTHGIAGSIPWYKLGKVKLLCPIPGYDRHFAITKYFGTEVTNVSMTPQGPDMDIAGELVSSDDTIKGIWCVPKYSNPQGYSYSNEAVRRFAGLEPAAPGFRVFWGNAYDVCHLYDHDQDHLIGILAEYKRSGNPDMVYKFASTSRIDFPGSGITVLATSHNDLEDIKAQLKSRTIGHDKANQLHHVHFFGDVHGMVEHMRKHVDVVRPKFETAEEILGRELGGLGVGQRSQPEGGYFVSFDSIDECAKEIVAKCKRAGIVMTPAGVTYPYGKDPHGSSIRIAPAYLPLGDLITASELFVLCVKLASVERLLKDMD